MPSSYSACIQVSYNKHSTIGYLQIATTPSKIIPGHGNVETGSLSRCSLSVTRT